MALIKKIQKVPLPNMEMWQKNIKRLLAEKKKTDNWSHETLAKKIGRTRGQIGHYLRGRRLPPIDILQKIADAFEVSLSELMGADVALPISAKPHKIPLIDWQNIDQFLKVGLKSDDIKKIPYQEITIMLHEGDKIPPYLVALVVTGDAMKPVEFHSDTLCEGDIVIIDLTRKPLSHDIVLFQSQSTGLSKLRQYMQEGGEFFLKALNKDYPRIPLSEDINVMGVVIYVIREKKHSLHVKQTIN